MSSDVFHKPGRFIVSCIFTMCCILPVPSAPGFVQSEEVRWCIIEVGFTSLIKDESKVLALEGIADELYLGNSTGFISSFDANGFAILRAKIRQGDYTHYRHEFLHASHPISPCSCNHVRCCPFLMRRVYGPIIKMQGVHVY